MHASYVPEYGDPLVWTEAPVPPRTGVGVDGSQLRNSLGIARSQGAVSF